jgi:hypothetical protein
VAAVTGLTLIKRFTYRGDPLEEFSNTYHFKGPPPGDNASWQQLAIDAWNREGLVLPSSVTLVRAYGYDSDDPKAPHVWTLDFTVPGPPPAGQFPSGPGMMAGDQAACVWWKTSRLNTRGKAVYLRKYLHSGFIDDLDSNALKATYATALTTFAGTGANGIQSVHGGLRSRTHDENVQAAGHVPWVTTRTLKRRGKRPRTPA